MYDPIPYRCPGLDAGSAPGLTESGLTSESYKMVSELPRPAFKPNSRIWCGVLERYLHSLNWK